MVTWPQITATEVPTISSSSLHSDYHSCLICSSAQGENEEIALRAISTGHQWLIPVILTTLGKQRSGGLQFRVSLGEKVRPSISKKKKKPNMEKV
jgi:hypothetical protein